MPLLFFENKFFPGARQAPNYTQSLRFSETGVAYASNGTFYAESYQEKGGYHHYRPTSNERLTLKNWIFKTFGDDTPVETPYEPGTFYKRISRPGGPFITSSIENINQSFVALRILLEKLQILFDTIEPHPDNAHAFGHKIRELLLLACMEVESSWSAVLMANNYSGDRWSTKDYFKLKKAMFLDGYKIGLSNYPSYPPFQPFIGWDSLETTRSLPWYDAYNKTKHDREKNLNLTTLEHAITAVGAVVTLFFAQFGMQFNYGNLDSFFPIIRSVFWSTQNFTSYRREFYLPGRYSPAIGSKSPWKEIDYAF